MAERDHTLSRRELIGKTGAAVGAGMAWNILPVHAAPTSRPARVMQNDKVVIGLIGCGGMGAANMRNLMRFPEVQVAALCDVDDSRMPKDIADVEKQYGKKPDTYKDFRKMLERKDINAVIVGTPDHWHAIPLIMACEAGKDAYCEKPISRDITEAKAMAAAVKHFNRIVQVGTWQRSTKEFTDAVNYVRSGKAGKIVAVRAWKTDPMKAGNGTVTTPPASLDYDFWTGPAPMLPYAANHVHRFWRYFKNYGTGMTGDWGVHMMDIGMLGMTKDTDMPMPTEVSSFGGKLAYPDDDRTWPDTVHTIMKFKDPDFILHWETGRDVMGRPDHGTEFIGAEGRVVRAWRGGWKIMDPFDEEVKKEPGEETTDHWRNWLDCLRTREQPRSNLASMAQTTITCHLANCSYLSGETVHFDKAKMDIVGKAGKDTPSYYREYRKPWKLPMYKV
jgi:predicted dehydrogenase